MFSSLRLVFTNHPVKNLRLVFSNRSSMVTQSITSVKVSREHFLQFLVLFMRDERVLLRPLQMDDVRPAPIGGDVFDVVEVDDVAFVAAEEDG